MEKEEKWSINKRREKGMERRKEQKLGREETREERERCSLPCVSVVKL